MPEISENCEFETSAECIVLKTWTNGDEVKITGVHFSQGQVASLAWLINKAPQTVLSIEIKEKV